MALEQQRAPRHRVAIAALLTLLLAGTARASEISVPPRLQASLTAKVAPFDRSLLARADKRVLVLVAVRAGNAESARVAGEFISALREETNIAGLPFEVASAEVDSVARLLSEIRLRKPAIAYLSAGFSDDVEAIASGLVGADVLTISAESGAVQRGICVGFNLVSGKPRVLVHLQQSRKQHVNFASALLALAMVVDQ